jgi:CRP-like cAMP-binding protein
MIIPQSRLALGGFRTRRTVRPRLISTGWKGVRRALSDAIQSSLTFADCAISYIAYRANPRAGYIAQLLSASTAGHTQSVRLDLGGVAVPHVDLENCANTLLSALSETDRALLNPHLEPVELDRGQVLVPLNEPIEYVHFLQNGIASITARSPDSGVTEIGIIGRDGMCGTSLLLCDDRSPHETFIQVAPADALRLKAERFTAAVEASATLRQIMLRYVKTLLVQAGQCAVANARHQIEARLARWLLMCHDRTDGDEIALTHEFMAVMIAAQRSGVTVALHILEGTGTIRSRRNLVVIRNRAKLEELAGDAYGVAEAEYRRLIGPLGSTPQRGIGVVPPYANSL